MQQDTVRGLDIGGTKCALVIGDRQGNTLERWQVNTAQYACWETLVDTLLQQAVGQPRPLAVGVSCGGPLDARRGLILSPPNLPGWDEVPITQWLNQRLHVPAFLQNDANACTLAEWRYGAGKGCQHMVFLTFGTGMGAGLILNGRLYEGANGMAGEVGQYGRRRPRGLRQARLVRGFAPGKPALAQQHMGATVGQASWCWPSGDQQARTRWTSAPATWGAAGGNY